MIILLPLAELGVLFIVTVLFVGGFVALIWGRKTAQIFVTTSVRLGYVLVILSLILLWRS